MAERTATVRAATARAASVAASVALAFAILALGASPAAAHAASGPRPTDYRTRIESIAPRIAGVTVRVVDLGNKLQVTNHTATDLVVLGSFGEPYLRIGPSGVFENLRSPATYRNRTRAGTTAVPAIARGTGASTPPRWRRVSGSHTATWHDHRVHWMGSSPPAAVRADPNAFHAIDPWTVVLRYGSHTVLVRGTLDWVPGPSGRPWLPFALGLFVLGVGVTRSRPGRAAIAAIVVLVAADAGHVIAAEIPRAGSQLSKTLQFLGDNFVSVILWVVAAATIAALRRRRVEAAYGTLLVGAMVALVSGLTDGSYLWKSQLPTVGPDLVARAEVATALGLGLGLAAGASVSLLRSAQRRVPRPASDPRWLERLVGGLDDDAVAVESRRLVAQEVVPLALADLAGRLAPLARELGGDALVFVVVAEDEIGSHVWSLTAAPGGDGVRVQQGRAAPARAELRFTFPAFLAVLGGNLSLDAAEAAGRLVIDGDAALLGTIEPRPHASEGRRMPAAPGQ